MNTPTNPDLVARYLYAVTRSLAPKTRPDVEQELDGLISDMVSERCGDATPTDADIRAVLTALGDPDEMAAKYSPDGQGALIAGSYFVIYKRVLRIVLPLAAGLVAVLTALSFVLDWVQDPSSVPLVRAAIGQVIAAAIEAPMVAFAVITLVFAGIERAKTSSRGRDFLAGLPAVPKAAERIKPHRPIVSMAFWVALTVVFLAVPQVIGGWTEAAGWQPVFTTAVIRGRWLPIIAWAALVIVKDVVRLVDGAYTVRVAVVTVVANVLIGVCAAAVFLAEGIMNPGFVAHLDDFMTGSGGRVVWVGGEHLNLAVLAIVGFALAIETVVAIVKTAVNRVR
ncbi:MAG: hypothetical protein FWC46_03430 [Actinomycetia bacterium]|nr:hypothetical protein [Actinomycetes bacterium]